MNARLFSVPVAALMIAGALTGWTPSPKLSGTTHPSAIAPLPEDTLQIKSPLLKPLPRKPVIVIYGDSLTVESEKAVQRLAAGALETVVFRAFGGTAMCDWTDQAVRDMAQLHPDRVVLAFTGNTASCVAADFRARGTAGAVADYTQALERMRAIYSTEPITVVLSPAMHNLPMGWFPFNGSAALNTMYRTVGARLAMTIDPEADDTLTPGHVFTSTRPLSHDGRPVVVRLSDGVHLTPAGTSLYGHALLDVDADHV